MPHLPSEYTVSADGAGDTAIVLKGRVARRRAQVDWAGLDWTATA